MSDIRIRLAVFLLFAQVFGAAALPSDAQEALTRGSFEAYAAEDAQTRVSDFSGLPVPRYASLRYDTVNGRAGPSRDYPVQWTYERAGLPVVIVRESRDWRKVRDPQGDEVWVNKSQLSSQRTLVTTVASAIRQTAESRSQPVARFLPGAILQVVSCKGAWCEVEAEGRKGFVLKSEAWGADDLTSAAAAK